MRQAKQQGGFALLVVIGLFGLIGMGLLVWTAQTKDLMIQTKLHTVQAGLDNALASVSQWAQINPQTLKQSSDGQWVRLDLKDLQVPGLECHYRVIDKNAQPLEIEIIAAGNFRSHTIKKTVRLSL